VEQRGASKDAPRKAPFAVGETLRYDVAWSPFLKAGDVTVSVRDQRSSFGATVFAIVAEGQPTPLVARLYPAYYRMETLVEVSSLLPQSASLLTEERGRRQTRSTRFNHGRRTAEYEVQSSTRKTTTLRLPGPTYDGLSFLYALRATRLERGATRRFYVADGGEVYTVLVKVEGQESVPTALGQRRAWKLVPDVRDQAGRAVGLSSVIWITDDAARVPIKLQAALPAGEFVSLLTSQRPKS
jgi:Protein of unknown function (DUF3108)